MSNKDIFKTATAGHRQVPQDWMPATQVRSFIYEDPVIVWLENHGEQHGFKADSSPYDFLPFIGEKGRQFEEKWRQEIAPEAIVVCQRDYEVRSADKVRSTFDLINKGTPVISKPALWWAPEKVYGVPDFLMRASWVSEKFPDLLDEDEKKIIAPFLEEAGVSDYYVVLDVKFTTELDTTKKIKDFMNCEAQVRIYSYILGHLQGIMPPRAFLITRDRILDPLPVKILSSLEEPLDPDLKNIRDRYLDIKLNGTNYLPWRDEIVSSNITQRDERWGRAKKIIALEKMPGKDSALLTEVSLSLKKNLNEMGFPNLDSMLREEPQKIPFEKCKGIGTSKAQKIRAILQVNRSGSASKPPSDIIPSKKAFEFYVDFEYFSNINVDFDKQWPGLDGCEMIFMIGVGWDEDGKWFFQKFVAKEESHEQELEMLESFMGFLETKTGGVFTDRSKAVLYHWTSPEVWQSKKAADRLQLPSNHPIRQLPWHDLQRDFINGSCGIPGAWDYVLKSVAKSLGQLNPAFDPQWPGDLEEGLRAMVMGWKAYQTENPLKSEEMKILKEYLEADCKALWQILRWIRS